MNFTEKKKKVVKKIGRARYWSFDDEKKIFFTKRNILNMKWERIREQELLAK